MNSYAEGTVGAGKQSIAGGFVGSNGCGSPSCTEAAIQSSYATGTAKVMGGSFAGGFAGEDFSAGLNTESYWDTTTSDRFKATGNRGNEPGIKGLTTTQLQSKLPTGFDPKIWTENPSINGGLPYLIANPPP